MELDWLLAPPLPEAVPRQRLLYLRLREAILSGRLPADARLPASRSLAVTLGIARNTVLFAYEQLVAEGCLVADRQGTRVAALPAAPLAMPTRLRGWRRRWRCPCARRRRGSTSPHATPKPCRSRPACRISAPFPSAPGAPASNVRGAMPAGVSSATLHTVAIRACVRRSRPT